MNDPYNFLLEQMFDGVFIYDDMGNVRYANSNLCGMLEYREDEIKKLNIKHIFHDSEAEQIELNQHKYTKNNNIIYEYHLVRKNGKYFQAHIKFLVAENNSIMALVSDLRELNKTQKKLSQSEALFQQMAESINDVFFLIENSTEKYLYISPAYEQIWGRPISELYTTSDAWIKAVHPEDKERIYLKYFKQLETGYFDDVFRIVRPDGETRWIHARTFPIFNESKQLVRTSGVAEDISIRHEALEQLRESERRFSHMLHNVELISVILDRQATILDCNDFLLKLSGWSHEEIIGKNWFDLFIPKEQNTSILKVFNKLLKNEEIVSHYENEILTRNGERLLIHWNNSLLMSPSGAVIGTASIGEDITERKKIEIERKNHAQEMLRGISELAVALTIAMKQSDPYTAEHQRRVACLAAAIAHELGLSEDQIYGLRLAAEMHDIGKMGIPISILNKPGQLTQLEFELVKTHSTVGYEILKNVHFPWPIAEIILQHHERLDGSGYPRGLKGDEILLEARILAVADVVEAVTSHRPYRPAFEVEVAFEKLRKGRGILFSEEIVEACIKVFNDNHSIYDV